MLNHTIICLAILSAIQATCQSCQLVAKNNHSTPPAKQQEKSANLLADMVADEILPSLTRSRSALTILDSIRSKDKEDDSLSDFVYELEKSFKSAAIPKADDSPKTADKDFVEVELPFIVGRHNQEMLAKISKNRDDKSQIFDMFGIIPPPPATKSSTVPLLSRMYDRESDLSEISYWFFDMPAFNNFLKILRDTKSDILDPDLSMQITTLKDTQELTVWSQMYKTGTAGIKWRLFHASSQIGSSGKIKIKMSILCNEKDTDFEFDVAPNELTGSLKDVFTNNIKSKLDTSCLLD